MTAGNARGAVAITGPSCVGKTTVARRLTSAEVTVLDLQVFARQRAAAGSAAGQAVAGLPSPRTYPDGAVDELLRDALVRGMARADGRLIVLPGMPATVAQVHIFAAVARTIGVPVAVVELEALTQSLFARRARRRICLRCCPDPGGEPHTVAPPGDERYIIDVSDDRLRDTCPVTGCRARLYMRSRDSLPVFRRRVHAYRVAAPTLRRAARAAGIPWYGVNTSDKEANQVSCDREYNGAADTRSTVVADIESTLTAAGLLPQPAALAAASASKGASR